MLQLVIFMLAAAMPQVGTGPPDRVILRDPMQGPTPVTDKWIGPAKIYDCKTEADDRIALDQRLHGETPRCWPKELDQKQQR